MKKALVLALLVLAGAVDVSLYWNTRLFDKAKNAAEDPAERIRLLEKADRLFPWNDEVHFELGRAYFDLGVNDLTYVGRRNAELQKSARSFARAIRLNPGNLQAHLQSAQTLLYMTYFSIPVSGNYFEEFKKAAQLTGHNSHVFFEVGKILLSRWAVLSSPEKEFTLDILQKMLVHKDPANLQTIFQIWDMNARDYSIMSRILPEDAAVSRAYAQFLGEKSLSLEERRKALAAAERFDYLGARSEFEAGERSAEFFLLPEAIGHFEACLKALDGIRFYQDLGAQNLIDLAEFQDLRRSACLELVKCRVEETRRLDAAEADLDRYLSLEDRMSAIGELEAFLRDRGALPAELSLNVKDLKQMRIQLLLSFKQNRYRDITALAGSLDRSLFMVPESMKPDYEKILLIFGDAFQKLDYIYEAERFYNKALELNPRNLKAQIQSRKSYERLNDGAKALAAGEAILGILSPRERALEGISIPKGEEQAVSMILEGGKVGIRIAFASDPAGPAPLVAVFFNGRIVWEDHPGEGGCRFTADAVTGANSFIIRAVNGTAVPIGVFWEPILP
ncbi:MAG: tetratricopeptide repeat protein [Candidatus Aminicenantales bacterium]